MKIAKLKNEIYFKAKRRTYHLFWVGVAKTMYWIKPHSFDEYVEAFGLRHFAFRWTTFYGFVLFGIGFAVSDFEQQKAKIKAEHRLMLNN